MNKYQITLVASIKGFVHAFIMPIVIMFASLYTTESIYAFLTPFAYIAFASYVYATSKNKDISKLVFFKTLQVVLLLVLLYLLMIIS